MKNAKSILVAAMMVMTISTYANVVNTNNNEAHTTSVEEKRTLAVLNKVLPVSISAIESPAPQKATVSVENQKYSALQKAAIVDLQLKHAPKK